MKRIGLTLIFISISAGLFAAASQEKLLDAVLANRLADVKTAVENGAKVNFRYDKGRTALHWAVLGGNLKIVAYLITKGADVNARDQQRVTPLHNAATKNNLDLVKYLVLKGANINAPDQYGWTPLHYFTYYQNTLIVKFMIMQEAELTNRSTREFMKIPAHSTPLDIATRLNLSNIIAALQEPDRYTGLLRRPSLAVYPELSFGADGKLMALESGEVRVTVSNKGGGNAANVEVYLEGLSNTSGLLFNTNLYLGGIATGSTRTQSFRVQGLRFLAAGQAHFRVMARETTLPKDSPWVEVNLPLAGWLPPDYAVTVVPERSEFRAGEEGFLAVSLSNAGQGYAEALQLKVLEISNSCGLGFGWASNALLAPGQSVKYRIAVSVPLGVTDQTAVLAVEVSESNSPPKVIPALTVPVVHFMKPELRAELVFKAVFTYETNYRTNEINGLSNLPPVLEILTNLTASSETNYEPYLALSNAGEGPARDLDMELQMAVPGALPSDGMSRPIVYRVPELLPGGVKFLRYPSLLQGSVKEPNLELRVRGGDSKRTVSVETNLRVVLP